VVQPAPLAAEGNGPVQQGVQQRVVVVAARPSGAAAYLNHNIGVFSVRDGKIASVREYTDTQRAERILFAAR
jgi:ketosteroid isomerase-like protein